jgi:hypothetical protein
MEMNPGEIGSGKIVAHDPANYLRVSVLMEEGHQVTAVIPKSVVRKLGFLAGSLAGWDVQVKFQKSPRLARVVELRKTI